MRFGLKLRKANRRRLTVASCYEIRAKRTERAPSIWEQKGEESAPDDKRVQVFANNCGLFRHTFSDRQIQIQINEQTRNRLLTRPAVSGFLLVSRCLSPPCLTYRPLLKQIAFHLG